jgi:hypothetical protein
VTAIPDDVVLDIAITQLHGIVVGNDSLACTGRFSEKTSAAGVAARLDAAALSSGAHAMSPYLQHILVDAAAIVAAINVAALILFYLNYARRDKNRDE